MADKYTIEIGVNDYTLQQLKTTGESLRAYKGVKASIQGGLCPVWFSTNNFSKDIKISWEESYSGYIDSQELHPGIVIDASNTEPMNLGNLMIVEDNGTATVTNNGTPGNIDIKNGGVKEWTCGMGQLVNNNMATLCAFTLFGNHSVLMEPYEQILLVFESGQTDTGTVVEETLSNSIIITLTGDDVGTTKNVTYDINNGWDAQGAAWAQVNVDSVNIADKLIVQM